MGHYIYLDDVRTPTQVQGGPEWIVVRNYDEFVEKVTELGLDTIHTVSLDHDLGDTAMQEYYSNVSPNFKLDYDNIQEKTGYDCAKWLIEEFYKNNKKREKMSRFEKKQIPIKFPHVYTHSANPIGSANIMGYVNNFFMNEGMSQDCIRVGIPHK